MIFLILLWLMATASVLIYLVSWPSRSRGALASRSPLPLIPWRQDAPAFNVTELTGHEQPIRCHLALPHVRRAGSHTSCGCGFNQGASKLY